MNADVAYALRLFEHPRNAGASYALTDLALREEFGGKFEDVPVPACEHAVFYDALTGIYVFERPKPDGSYVSDKKREYILQGRVHKVEPLKRVR